MSSLVSERRLEQANLITKEKLPILKRSQNKPPQTINDLQFISHVITYNIACFQFYGFTTDQTSIEVNDLHFVHLV